VARIRTTRSSPPPSPHKAKQAFMAKNGTSNHTVMLHEALEGLLSERLLPIDTSSSSKNEDAIPESPTFPSNLSRAQHSTTTPNPIPPTLACPVSGCPLVFEGKMPYGYLWRHLKRPGIYGRTGDEKVAWLDLQKYEYDRLLATRGRTPPFRKPTSGGLIKAI